MSDPFAVDFRRRSLLAGGAGAVLLAAMALRLAHLQLRQRDLYMQAAQDNRIRINPEPGPRGLIYDRSGTILAANKRDFMVTMVPEDTPEPGRMLQRLSGIIDLSPPRREQIIEDIGKNPGFVEILVADNMSWEEFSRINVRLPELPGLTPRIGTRRAYPLGEIMAHPLGYVARPDEYDIATAMANAGTSRKQLGRLLKHPQMRVGKSGLEATAEQWLAGSPGYRRSIINADGRIVQETSIIGAKAGRPIVLALDAQLQKHTAKRFGDQAGAVVVLHIATGQIIAMVSRPGFDPNAFIDGISVPDYAGLRQDRLSPLFNRAHDGVYPPGSVFKPIVAAAALEAGLVDPQAVVKCEGKIKLGRRYFHCWEEEGHGEVNLHQAIVRSCDSYFYELARQTGLERITAMARRFGFGQRHELGLPGGASGLVPDRDWKRQNKGENWMLGETLNLGIGQGYISSTPLQLALMAARLGSAQQSLPPSLILDGPPVKAGHKPKFEPLSPDTAQRLRQGMYGVTSETGGTALFSGALGFDRLRLAGKTGTAQVRSISQNERDNGLRDEKTLQRHLRDHALFIAYAPHDEPRYACSVIVEHGGSGSRAAAPIARDLMAMAVRHDPAAQPEFTPKEQAVPRSQNA